MVTETMSEGTRRTRSDNPRGLTTLLLGFRLLQASGICAQSFRLIGPRRRKNRLTGNWRMRLWNILAWFFVGAPAVATSAFRHFLRGLPHRSYIAAGKARATIPSVVVIVLMKGIYERVLVVVAARQ